MNSCTGSSKGECDEINQISIDHGLINLSACDDMGDLTIFDPKTLAVKHLFSM